MLEQQLWKYAGGKKAKNKDRQLMLKQTKTHTKPTSQQNWIQMKEVESILFNYGKTVPCLSPFPIIFSTMWGALLHLCIGTKSKKVVMSLLSVCYVFFIAASLCFSAMKDRIYPLSIFNISRADNDACDWQRLNNKVSIHCCRVVCFSCVHGASVT